MEGWMIPTFISLLILTVSIKTYTMAKRYKRCKKKLIDLNVEWYEKDVNLKRKNYDVENRNSDEF